MSEQIMLDEDLEMNPDDYMVSQYDEESNEDFFGNPDGELIDSSEEGVESDVAEEEDEEAEVEEGEAENVEEEVVENATDETVDEATQQGLPDPEQAKQILQNWETELEDRYQKLLTPDKALQVLSDPEKVLPALLKEVHIAAVRDAAQMFQQMMPIAAQTNFRQMTDAQKNEQEFFAANQDLLPIRSEFDQFLQQYRTLPMNVKRTFRDISQEAARVFRARTGMTMEVAQKTRRVRPAPPAIGGSGATAPTQRDNNPFAQLAEEFLVEEV